MIELYFWISFDKLWLLYLIEFTYSSNSSLASLIDLIKRSKLISDLALLIVVVDNRLIPLSFCSLPVTMFEKTFIISLEIDPISLFIKIKF